MKILKILLITILIVVLVVPTLGCGIESDEAGLPETQIITVQRGDLTIDITAAGNLALSDTEDLAFDLFYQEGTVEEVLVEEGDIVTAGQVLARLDTEEWEDQVGALEDEVTTEERGLLQAQINLQTAEQNLNDSRDNKASKELALLNAQISLDQANYHLSVAEETYTWPDIEVAEAEVEKAEAFLQYALDGSAESSNATWDRLITRAQAELAAAEQVYDALVEGYDTEEVAIKKKQVEAAEMSLVQAQKTLDKVADDVTKKELEVKLKIVLVEDASKALEDAEKELDKANGKSPIIVALFDGFITRVNVEGGDEVMTGTVAVQLADPNKFEADIMVSEMDILQVKEGGEASVQVDAMPGISLPATVIHIAPTATIQSGVVNYEVKVKVESLEAVMQERQETKQKAMQGIQQGELPERLKQAIAAGQITREQAEEMMKQGQQAHETPQTQMPAMVPEGFQLREGLTVIVSILVEERTGVLLVPNSAITRKGNETYVPVMSPDGSTTERLIQIGISDWQYTEVISGLSEGEEVVVTVVSSPDSTSSTSGGRGPMFQPPHD